jgi:hypothetical protein
MREDLLLADLRRPARGTASPKPASQNVVLNGSEVASNSSAGAPGIGHEQPRADGRFVATYLMNRADLPKRVFDIDM